MGAIMINIIKVSESYGYDYYVYQGENLVRVCPSIDMAQAVAASLTEELS